MSEINELQFKRKVSLILVSGDRGIDLSDFRIRFDIQATDVETPNNAAIRVYNLAPQTVTDLREYNQVVLNAGYDANFGVIFKGTIRQFRIGRENAKDTYLDILAADWDIGYNQGFVNTSLQNPTPAEVAREAVKSMVAAENAAVGTDISVDAVIRIGDFSGNQHVPQLRGKVLFGMARARLRDMASSLDASWSVQDGVVQILPLRGYEQTDTVLINQLTGMVGIPEQTETGIVVKVLLNPRIRVGGLIQLDNSAINQLLQQDPNAAPIPYNQFRGWQYSTKLSPSGHYRVFVAEHEGDTRGQEWYTTLICLAVDMTAQKNEAVIAKN